MTDNQLHNKLSDLPANLKSEVAEFIDFLKYRSKRESRSAKRLAGKAKGLIAMKNNFDEPIEDHFSNN